MAIVKMKRLRVIAMASCREELLRQLQRLGCVEIREPESAGADWSGLLERERSRLAETRAALADVNAALSAVKKYADVREGMFPQRQAVTQTEFLSGTAADRARAASARVSELVQTASQLQAEEGRLLAKQASLVPWKGLDMPLELTGTVHTAFLPGVCPAAADLGALRQALGETACELLEISADKQQRYCLLVCHRAEEAQALDILRTRGFSAVSFQGLTGTPAENLRRLEGELQENRGRQAETADALRKSGADWDTLRLYADRLRSDTALEEGNENLLTDGTILFFEGWAPADRLQGVGALLDHLGCAWEAEDPKADEYPDVPVRLRNNWFSRPLNMVTDMYALPVYGSLDPNPLMAPFFILFYGIMMADMGYGLLMLAMGLFLWKKKVRGTMDYMGGLLVLCGISTFVVGALTGGFFGDFLSQLAKLIDPKSTFALPYLFTPLTDTMAILIGSLVLGFVQILTGMVISFVKKARDGHIMDGIWDEGTWWVIFLGGGLAVLGIGNVAGYPAVLILGILMLIIGSSRNAKGFGKVTSVFGAVYNGVTGYFSDIMSYSRLMALMLSGSIIASVFNQLGAVTGNVIAFVIISALGNALNFALNLLGCYVHDLRLQCLEFFNRFYESGGKPFRPLAYQTNYVEIKEEH
ncbi:V-type ATP synthase subunit I [uncultured Oscillibacter sp.]|uniref:V-type ATP synthase subunit I n=1 Tax=uncultured Oscillibacter sp. TaxID=876091 RepID=UPI001FA512E8|nr:V-type ATP synthase subunit I [uncultured Oscillibacter sp.]HJB76606.1 V-type ATP synthase subunit I [Candidatus Oscillibacter avistercoris]